MKQEKSSTAVKKYSEPEKEGTLYGIQISQWSNSKCLMEEIELFEKGRRVCFARVQTSQILFDSKERFNKVLAMRSNLDGDGCPSCRCHKVVKVFEGGDDSVTWVASDGMKIDLFDVIATK